MNLLRASRNASVEYDSAISTCASDVAVHTKITPHAFVVVRLFTVPTMESGPNRSTAMDQKGGVGPIRWAGRGAITWLPNSFARLLHVKQAFFTACALGRILIIHTRDLLLMTMASTPA